MAAKVKKPKALTPIQKVKVELEEQKKKTEEMRQVAVSQQARSQTFEGILEAMREFLEPKNNSRFDRIPYTELPFKVNELLQYQKRNEAAINIGYESAQNHNRQLVEIVRWHVNPASAIPAKCVDQRPNRMYCESPNCQYCRSNGRNY